MSHLYYQSLQRRTKGNPILKLDLDINTNKYSNNYQSMDI